MSFKNHILWNVGPRKKIQRKRPDEKITKILNKPGVHGSYPKVHGCLYVWKWF